MPDIEPINSIIEGKTKKIEALGNGIVRLANKPAITAEDGERKEILDGKDVFATTTTANIFSLLTELNIPNHFFLQDSPNSILAFACNMIPLEVVIRRKVGTKSSYLKRNPEVKPGTNFTDLVVEFFIKDDPNHDPIIVFTDGKWFMHDPKKPISDASCLGEIEPLCTVLEIEEMEKTARKVFSILEQAWAILGITLEDLKIEFGRALAWKLNATIILADVIDNDSWRITKDGEDISKQVFRDGGSPEEVRKVYKLVAELSEQLPELASKIKI